MMALIIAGEGRSRQLFGTGWHVLMRGLYAGLAIRVKLLTMTIEAIETSDVVQINSYFLRKRIWFN
jgi:hypothetical protein